MRRTSACGPMFFRTRRATVAVGSIADRHSVGQSHARSNADDDLDSDRRAERDHYCPLFLPRHRGRLELVQPPTLEGCADDFGGVLPPQSWEHSFGRRSLARTRSVQWFPALGTQITGGAARQGRCLPGNGATLHRRPSRTSRDCAPRSVRTVSSAPGSRRRPRRRESAGNGATGAGCTGHHRNVWCAPRTALRPADTTTWPDPSPGRRRCAPPTAEPFGR